MALRRGCQPCQQHREALLAWCMGPGRGRERGLWVGLRRMLEFSTRERKGMPDGSVGKGSAGDGLGQSTA